MTEQWSLTEPIDGIPEPTPDELKRLSREGGAYRPQHSGEAT